MGWFASGAALCAAFGLLFLWSRNNSHDLDRVALKGGPSLEVLAINNGMERRTQSGDLLGADDSLSFVATCPGGCDVVLVDVAPKQAPAVLETSVLAPWRIAPGESQQLPVSGELDAANASLLLAFFCERASRTEILRAVGAADWRMDGDVRDLENPPDIVVEGCAVRSHYLRSQ